MDNKDKQALINGTATIPYKIHVLNDDGNIKDTLTEEDIVSTDYEDYRYVDSSSLCIGQFVARKLKGEVKVIDKDLQIEDNEISVEMGVNRNDGSKEYALSIEGKSEQETTKGNQLIDFNNYEFIDGNTTSTFSNDVLTVSNTAGTYRSVKWNILDLAKANPGKTLYFTFEKYDYSNCPAPAVNIRQVLNGNATYPYLVNSKGYCTAVTIPKDIDNLTEFRIRVMSNNSSTSQAGTLKITKPMLQFGTDKLEYEPYTGGQPSPNPDYPSEIKTVKGIRNLFDKDNAKTQIGYFSADGTINSGGSSTITTSYTKIEPNIDITISGFIVNRILFYDENMQFLERSEIINTTPYTFNKNAYYIRFQGVSEVFNLNILKIEQGTTSHDYVPYGSWLQVKNTGKNLFKGFNLKSTSSGITFNYYEDGSISAVGTSTGMALSMISSNATNKFLLKAGTYTLSGGKTNIAVEVIKSNGVSIASTSIYKTFTIDEDTEVFVRLAISANKTVDAIIKPMLEEGSTTTEYEPYKETSTLIDMNKPNLFDNVAFVEGSSKYYSYDETTGITINKNDEYAWSSIGYKIQIGNNKQYKISVTNIDDYSTLRFGQFKSDGTWITAISPSSDGLVTFNSDCSYVTLKIIPSEFPKTIGFITLISGCDDYYELSSIGDTKDILTIQNGQATINQKIGKVVLDGSESNWAFKESNTNTLRATCDGLTGIKHHSLVMSPELPGYRNNSAIGAIDSIGIAPRDNGLGFTLRLPVNVATDVNTLKTYLSSNPVTVYYILEEPQTIELPRINKIESIDNTENISIATNIPTAFQITEFPLVNWYNLGNFLITKPTDDDVKGTLTFDSMDYTKKFNQTFDSTNIIFPCTALELAKYCCEQCGVELATTDFINNDFEVIDNQYTEEDTYRNVMQDIGKLAYSWVRIGWDNKCYIDFTYGTEVDEYNKITNDNYYDLEIQQKVFGPVNRVIIGMSDVEGENVYIEDEESISKYGATEIQIYDNNLTYTPELRNQAITNAKCLFGLTYTPMTLNTTGHPWLLGNEKCEVTYMDGTKQYTYPWDRTISYSGHIKTKLESKCDTKIETEYKYKGDVETLLNKTRIIVNKQEGTITSLTQTTETIQNNLQQNYYDRTQTNQLIQTSSTGITNTFSEAGGNNIFRNTGLWFEDSSTSYYIYPKSDLYPSNKTFTNGQRAYEFWDGLVLKEYYDKAANLTSLLLQNGYFEQKQQVPNGNYTVSFKYKKLIESATTKVIINNVEYNLTKLQDTEFRTGEQDSDGNYITQPLEVTDGYIFVRFYTNVNNSTIIYDLMVNAGSVKLAYSQNQNETTTDTVNISKGITITSSNTDTTFKANSDGIRTLNKNNETLSEFTDKGMKNKQIEVTDEATIVQVLIQNIGDQTWFTRL